MILLIRHGESIANAGATTENYITVPLTEKGHQQAYEVSLEISKMPDLIITSSYTRAIETAKYTENKYKKTKVETWKVEEFNYLDPKGCSERNIEDNRKKVNEYWSQLDPYYKDGETAESFIMVLERARSVYQSLVLLKDKVVLVFSHAQFIKVLMILRDYPNCDAFEMIDKFTKLPHIENCQIIKYL